VEILATKSTKRTKKRENREREAGEKLENLTRRRGGAENKAQKGMEKKKG
jgi:hypothetical protein